MMPNTILDTCIGDASPVDAGLTQYLDGAPVRLLGNGRKRRPGGLYFSIKSGRHMPYESRAELHDLWRAEVRSDVVRSWPQPFTLHFVQDGVLRRYTPDRKDLLANGRSEIIEVKGDLPESRDPLYAQKLGCVRTLLSARSMSFQINERAEIEAEPAFGAIETIQRYRRTRVGASEATDVKTYVDDRGRPLGEVLALLGNGPQALATVCALVVRRVIEIDLRRGLHNGASVTGVA